MSWRKQRKATSSSRKITSTWQLVSRWWSLCTSLWCLSTQPESGTISALSSTPPSGPSPCTTWQFHMRPTSGRLTSSRPRSGKSRRTRRWWETIDIGLHLMHAWWETCSFCVNMKLKSSCCHHSLWIRKRKRRSAALLFRKSCRRKRRSRRSMSREFCTASNWRKTTGCLPVRIPHFTLETFVILYPDKDAA